MRPPLQTGQASLASSQRRGAVGTAKLDARHQTMMGRLARFLARRPGSGHRILVKRKAALGDVLFTTPIIARLRRQNPDAAIYVQTDHPDVYRRNPDIAGIVSPDDPKPL